MMSRDEIYEKLVERLRTMFQDKQLVQIRYPSYHSLFNDVIGQDKLYKDDEEAKVFNELFFNLYLYGYITPNPTNDLKLFSTILLTDKGKQFIADSHPISSSNWDEYLKAFLGDKADEFTLAYLNESK